jgi:hypothetical protein
MGIKIQPQILFNGIRAVGGTKSGISAIIWPDPGQPQNYCNIIPSVFYHEDQHAWGSKRVSNKRTVRFFASTSISAPSGKVKLSG